MRVLTIGFALVAAPSVAAAQRHPLALLPIGDPAYQLLDALDRQGCRPARVSPYRPYTIGRIRTALSRATTDATCGGLLLDALRQRFQQSQMRPPREARSVEKPDSLDDMAEVAADLAEAVAISRNREPDTTQAVSLGFSLTARATALTGGEFRPLWRDVRSTGQGDSPVVGIARARGTWDGGPRIMAVTELYAQSDTTNDPRLRSRRFRLTGAAVDFSEAYLNGTVGKLMVSVGRAPEAWLGDGDESLVLSAHGPPLDRVLLSVASRRWEARAVYAVLDDVVLSAAQDSLSTGDSLRFRRALVAHVLSLTPTPWIEISLGESALLSRGSRVPDLGYANPLMLYILTQNDRGREGTDARDNLTIFGSVRARAGRATLGAELAVDDLQLDAGDAELTPNQLAWAVRASLPVPLRWPASVNGEYRRSDSFTYLRGFYTDVYQHYNQPLGSELGPGADIARGWLEVLPRGRLRMTAGAGLWRHGAFRIDERPSRSAIGQQGTTFPPVATDRPAVQRATLYDLDAQLLSSRLPIRFRIEAASIANANNQPAPRDLLVRSQLIATYAFRYP